MRILRIFLFTTAILLSTNTIVAQQKNIEINEPEAVKKLISSKRLINSSNTVNDKYRIQIFYGKNNEANNALNKFKRTYPEIDATIIYSNPSYKVMVGSFKTRLEAERNLLNIKKDFEHALIIKPGK
ncbi:SPOR domain-containing protein [Myroides indicus]|uniref:Sporulation related protein n=1 Tax=Myroides indicus TaxID=1323422 RepID=A0A4R7F8P3_9FLAO|nr:SPOR domain-containing protein [Myroides indicus]TDS63605.1 sporulation related protein [Myroides indicus]